VLLNRDLNLLCRIGEMRKAQVAEKEGRLLKNWQEKVIKENCLANRRKVAYLREVFKSKEMRL
jgi:hypothetical protein